MSTKRKTRKTNTMRTSKRNSKTNPFIACVPKMLPDEKRQEGAIRAVRYNPVNMIRPVAFIPKDRLSVLISSYWGAEGVKLTVSFMDNPPADVRKKILLYLNMWGERANVTFTETQTNGRVRIARQPDGYWSYLGTDIDSIPANEPTMNLEGFSSNTADEEYLRVVCHEGGHTLGFPHEHMRKAIIDKLDVRKTIAWGRRYLGWDERTVRQQILTPLSEQSIMGTPNAEETSIMCYQLPGTITKDGRPIMGGDRITQSDMDFAAKIYPKVVTPPPPPPGGEGELEVLINGTWTRASEVTVRVASESPTI